MTSLGKTISMDIHKTLSSGNMTEVYDEVGLIIQQKIRESNRRAVNPDGSARQPLSELYAEQKSQFGANPIPDLYLTGAADDELDFTIEDDGLEFGYQDPEIDNYMADHEFGRDGLPERRQFPTTQDAETPEQRDTQIEIEKILEKHLNSERVVVHNGN